mgnify:CR=1 FL=1
MATKITNAKSAETRVTRAEYLKDPFLYASKASDKHRVFVLGETGEVVKVIGGHLNHRPASIRGKRSGR